MFLIGKEIIASRMDSTHAHKDGDNSSMTEVRALEVRSKSSSVSSGLLSVYQWLSHLSLPMAGSKLLTLFPFPSFQGTFKKVKKSEEKRFVILRI